ncbi:hemerythrin domain-containing protein [Streptomyces tendae]|uniref:hemerythrin domain-containing protein n=1 Tax=Streptomyces tendae TaxID=1932 RepID=UPI003444416C
MTDTTRADSREMIAVHDMFRREFSASPGLVENVAPGDEEHAAVVVDHLAFVSRLLHAHHGAEDALLWPKLEQRAPEDTGTLLTMMRDDHEEIDKRLNAVTSAAAAWRTAADAKCRQELLLALHELLPALDRHLTAEESGALQLIDAHLSADEWAQVGHHGLAELPPEAHVLLFGMLLHDLDPELYELVKRTVPADVFDVVSVAGPQEYARHLRLLQGTA